MAKPVNLDRRSAEGSSSSAVPSAAGHAFTSGGRRHPKNHVTHHMTHVMIIDGRKQRKLKEKKTKIKSPVLIYNKWEAPHAMTSGHGVATSFESGEVNPSHDSVARDVDNAAGRPDDTSPIPFAHSLFRSDFSYQRQQPFVFAGDCYHRESCCCCCCCHSSDGCHRCGSPGVCRDERRLRRRPSAAADDEFEDDPTCLNDMPQDHHHQDCDREDHLHHDHHRHRHHHQELTPNHRNQPAKKSYQTSVDDDDDDDGGDDDDDDNNINEVNNDGRDGGDDDDDDDAKTANYDKNSISPAQPHFQHQHSPRNLANNLLRHTYSLSPLKRPTLENHQDGPGPLWESNTVDRAWKKEPFTKCQYTSKHDCSHHCYLVKKQNAPAKRTAPYARSRVSAGRKGEPHHKRPTAGDDDVDQDHHHQHQQQQHQHHQCQHNHHHHHRHQGQQATNEDKCLATEVKEIKRVLRSFMLKLQVKDERERLSKEWRLVALVLDRLLFYIYLIFIIVSMMATFPWEEALYATKLLREGRRNPDLGDGSR